MGKVKEMKFALGSILLAAVAVASPEPIDGNHRLSATQTTPAQDHFWALSDMFVGTLIGAYVPLNMYARNDDCYSRFWQLGALAVEYSVLADGVELK